jgi:putative Mn2+ efflux pump MntP
VTRTDIDHLTTLILGMLIVATFPQFFLFPSIGGLILRILGMCVLVASLWPRTK